MNYEPIIGLEIHVQLATNSKMFCRCANSSQDLSAEPNSTVCPTCLGYPGTLPYPNRQAIDWTILAGLAMNCKIAGESKFDRKHYFYPDLPKGYQISQYDQPFCEGGYLKINVDGEEKKVRLIRIHLEEDAGKLIHDPKTKTSLVDFNRAGTPLIEIVTEPCLHSPEEAKEFLKELKLLIQYLGISSADMEKGQLRCDANVSLRPEGQKKLGTKTEIKNLNSFKAVHDALKYEIVRQREILDDGGHIEANSTRGWNEAKGQTVLQRVKEEAADYRYFPDPDLPPLKITGDWASAIKLDLPELPAGRRRRFQDEYGLSAKDAAALVSQKNIADYFEETVSEADEWIQSLNLKKELQDPERQKVAKMIANWLLSELFKLLKETQTPFSQLKITPENFAELIALLYDKKLNSSAAQQVLKDMFERGSDPSHVMEEKNLGQVSDVGVLDTIAQKVIQDNPGPVKDFKAGKQNALQFLIGQMMKESKGKADPKTASDLLRRRLQQK